MEYGTIYLILVLVFGFFMAWGIGANDVANAMGTSVGSGALTMKQALWVAAIFEFCGAFLAGGEVTKTIRKGIIDSEVLHTMPETLVLGMLASLLAAAVWLFFASRAGWPVSTTHSIVGAIVGFAVVSVGVDAVYWSKVGHIALSWVVTPMIAGIVSFAIFKSIQRVILQAEAPFIQAKKYVPFYAALAGGMIALVTLFKGLKYIGLQLSPAISYLIALGVTVIVFLFALKIVRHIRPPNTQEEAVSRVENIFAALMVVTAAAMAFAHGSNDVANAIGPVAAVIGVVNNGGEVQANTVVPLYVLLLGAVAIVVGLMTYGHRVMQTIGEKITHLTPSLGFAAELSAASTVVLASGIGLPISTTQTLIGAVLGVGFAQGVSALNTKVIRSIVTSWVITLPAGAGLSVLFFYLLKLIFG